MDKQLNMKTCSKCNLTKLEEDFYKSSRTSVCKVCHLEITREYKRQKRLNPDFVKNEGLKQKERRVRMWQNTLLHDCKHRKQDVDIDVDYINFLFKKQKGKCFWFGVPLIPSNTRKHPQQPSLDRLDNNLGYFKNNVVLSCYSANIGRNDTDKDIWIKFIKEINPNIY